MNGSNDLSITPIQSVAKVLSDIRAQISHLNKGIRTQVKGKLLSQSEASTSCKIGGINIISYIFCDNIPEMTTTISLKRGKVLYESIFKNNEVKRGDDSIQQHNDDTNDTTTSTYKPPERFPLPQLINLLKDSLNV